VTTVQAALSAVMGDVQSVRKGDRNQQQNFNFRGIDAVVNAVGPALRKHGVMVVPVETSPTFESYQSRQGAQMRNCTLRVTWRFYGPEGDFIEAQSMGEAADAGDKAVAKAHSVALRIVLLQALCIPTDEPDPDTQAHERAAASHPEDERAALRSEIWRVCSAKQMTADEIRDDFAAWSQGEVITDATAGQLRKYLDSQKQVSS